LKRIAQLLRSVLPVDFWQLVFLSGAVFLFIAPHLPWREPQSIYSSVVDALDPNQMSEARRLEWSRIVLAMVWPINFAGLAAYSTCFWSGKRPARRILLAVIIPNVCSLAILAYKFIQLQQEPCSIFAAPCTATRNHLGFLSNISHLPPALSFDILGLLLIFVFTFQFLRGKSSLPLALPDGPTCGEDETESWPQLKILVFTLIGPLFLLELLINLPLGVPFLLSPGFRIPAYGNVARILGDMLSAAFLVLLAVWIVRKPAKVDIRRSLQLPEPRHAFFAALISTGACFSIPFAECLFDRVRWVEHGSGRLDAPVLSNYFHPAGIENPWLLLLLLGAFAEEIVFRGVLLPRMLQRYGLERGILLTGLIWAAFHFRGDSYSELSVGGVFLRLGHRIVLCVALNYVFAWMTLRWRSVIPAAVAHSVWNMLATSGVGVTSPWNSDFALISWTIFALILYHFWSLPKVSYPEPELPSASQTFVT
jgi:membrane protease YdiL (CAAX protease family)